MMSGLNAKVYVNKNKCPVQKDICKVISICPTGAVRFVADEAEQRLWSVRARMLWFGHRCATGLAINR